MRLADRVAVAACLCAFGATSAAAQEFSWRYYGSVPAVHDVGAIVAAGLDRVNTRSEGRLSISYTFYGETPYKPTEAPILIRDGLVELTEWLPAYSSGTYPLLTGPELPFAAENYIATAELHAQTQAAWENDTIEAYEGEVLADHNAVRITRIFYDPMNLWFKDDFNSFEDLQGLRIRAISPEQAEFLSAVGATPVTLPGQEVYTALQRGLIDATIIGSSAIESFRLREVVNTGLTTNVQILSTGMLASARAMDQLPDDLKAIFLEEMAAVEAEARAFIVEQEARDIAEFQASGMKIVRPEAELYQRFRDVAVNTVWPAWAARAGDGSREFLQTAVPGAN